MRVAPLSARSVTFALATTGRCCVLGAPYAENFFVVCTGVAVCWILCQSVLFSSVFLTPVSAKRVSGFDMQELLRFTSYEITQTSSAIFHHIAFQLARSQLEGFSSLI